MRARVWLGLAVLMLGGCAQARPEPTEAPARASVSAEAEPSPLMAEGAPSPVEDAAPPGDEATSDEAHPSMEEVSGLPTEAEFRAWDRKDSAAEAHLYAWDQQNLGRLLGYVDELRCFQLVVVAAGEHHWAGKDDDTQWAGTKQQLFMSLDAWQKQLFAKEPQIFENSKLIGHLLEAHELLMSSYLMAYDHRDPSDLERSHAHWKIVERKIRTYVERLGGRLPERPERCRAPTGG